MVPSNHTPVCGTVRRPLAPDPRATRYPGRTPANERLSIVWQRVKFPVRPHLTSLRCDPPDPRQKQTR